MESRNYVCIKPIDGRFFTKSKVYRSFSSKDSPIQVFNTDIKDYSYSFSLQSLQEYLLEVDCMNCEHKKDCSEVTCLKNPIETNEPIKATNKEFVKKEKITIEITFNPELKVKIFSD